MYDDPTPISTSWDAEFLYEGDAFVLRFQDGAEILASISEVQCDGDSDPETGAAISYVSGAAFTTAGGETGCFSSEGMGDFGGKPFHTAKRTQAFFDADDARRRGNATLAQKGILLGALEVSNGRVSAENAKDIAAIVGDSQSFRHFDSLAGSGSARADEQGAWKVRQARNLNVDGVAVFFEALKGNS